MMPFSYKNKTRLWKIGSYLILAIGMIIVLFPLVWTIITSISPSDEMFTMSLNLIPDSFTTEHYSEIIFDTAIPKFYLNSIIISAGVVLLTTVAATLGGYGLARVNIPFKRWFARSILFGYMFPAILLSIPMFIFWRQIGLINSYLGLILAETALCLPFSLWLMWQYFQTVPYSLEESAQMCGATRFYAFRKVALPLATPGIIAIAIFSYAVSWNQYTMPLILLPERSNWVLTIGIQSLQSGNSIFWGQVTASIVLIIVPSFVFVFLLQRYLLRGFRIGGVG